MSDDLVKQARDCANGLGYTKTERGDLGIFDDLADRIEELEAKLAKAVAIAKDAIETMECGPFFPDREGQRLLAALRRTKQHNERTRR